MKILGIIPARYSSSRFPGKPLIDLKGKSMIERVYFGAKKCKLIDKVLVATDDERIEQHVKGFGGDVELTSEHHRSGTERCAEIIEKYQDFDVVLNIQGDEPLINPHHLETILALFENQDTEIGTLITSFTSFEEIENKNRIKVVIGKNGNALYFSRSIIPFQEWKVRDFTSYKKHIGVYAFRSDVLKRISAYGPCNIETQESLEQLRWLYHGHTITTAFIDEPTPNIDVPEDVQRVLDLL